MENKYIPSQDIPIQYCSTQRFSYTDNPMLQKNTKTGKCLYCPLGTSKMCQAAKLSYLDVNKMHK